MNRKRTLSADEVAERLDRIGADVARLVRVLEHRPEKAIADASEPIAISAAEVARLLSIRREKVYRLHHTGKLTGFRVDETSDLRFLISEVREFAERSADESRHV